MKKLIIISISIISLLMAGCKKDESKTAPGSIYGTVTDKATGECVSAAGVELMPKGLKTVTGSDGTFQFTEIDPGEYNLFITKSGYQDLKSSTITVKSGEQAKGDVQIEKLPASLQIMDNDGQIISELNFGGDPGIISKTFKIINRGTTTLNFRINKYVDWIESITPNEGTIPVNRDCPIILKIDREKLADGSNTTSIIITSEDGGVELIVKARKGISGDVFELPAAHLMVQLEDLGCVNWSSASSMCNSSTVAGYTDWRLPTKDELMTLYSNREEIGGFSMGKYWSSSTISTSGGIRYHYVNFTDGTLDYDSQWSEFHVRAVRTMTQENGVMELPTANLMVQTADLGCVDWDSADEMCTSSIVGNYNDWRLPTRSELMTLYNNRDIIGGFTTGYYWTNESFFSSDPVGWYSICISFSNGTLYQDNQWETHYCRAVRDLNNNSATIPTVTTTIPTNVTASTAKCGGNATSDGGADVTERGICLSKNPDPYITNSTVFKSGSGTGMYTIDLTNLSNNTTYYVKAYAKNSEGIAYGEERPFTTDMFPTFQYGGETYQVAPDPGNNLTWENANSYSNNLTLYGFSGWRLPTKEELLHMYFERTSIGGFDNSYYWSKTNCDDEYHNMVFFDNGNVACRPDYNSFSIRPIRPVNGGSTEPTVTTTEPSNVTTNSATCGGNVTSDGGATVTARGVCWSTSSNPSVNGNHVQASSGGTGSFTCNITGLSENTTYYVKAYATNSEGTAYGDPIPFTTTSSGGGGQTYSYSFESSWENWTTIDADGDGYAWKRFYSLDVNIGHNNSIYTMGSESYDNDNFLVLYPDNYLVSPQKYAISSGAKISFYVCAQDSDYPAEHYGVAISTTSNPIANSFTTIWEETLSAKTGKSDIIRGNREQGTWYFKTIDLSSYSGQIIWIAIRHFNCTDQFILDVDDITIVTGN